MRFALILIAMALVIAVGFSWVPAEQAQRTISPDAVEDSAPGPVYYDTIPVEYIDFEPLYVNVEYVALDTYKHSELY